MPPSPVSKPTTCNCSPDATASWRGRAHDSLAVGVALALLRAYKLVLSPLFAGSCRFMPSCSDYMAEAIRVYGLAGGLWRGVRRLARCRPLGGHGFDPVPPRP